MASLRHEDNGGILEHPTGYGVIVDRIRIHKQRSGSDGIRNRAGRFDNYSVERMHRYLVRSQSRGRWETSDDHHSVVQVGLIVKSGQEVSKYFVPWSKGSRLLLEQNP